MKGCMLMIIIHHIHPADTSEEVSSELQAAMGTFQPSEKSQVAVTSPALLKAESL